MKNKEDIDYKIHLYLEGNISQKDKKDLLDWLKDNQENRNHFFLLKNLYEYPLRDKNNIATCEVWETLEKEIKPSLYPNSYQPFLKYILLAASLITFIFLGSKYILSKQSTHIPENTLLYSELITPPNSIVNLTLPDGSQVELHEKSKLVYPTNIEKGEYKVLLEGEASFHINKNIKRTFKVKTNSQEVQVLGTTFYIKDHPNAPLSHLILSEGSLLLHTQENKKEIKLKPADRITFDKKNNTIEKDIIHLNLTKAFETREYKVDNITLEQLLKDIEVLFSVNIHIKKSSSLNKRFSGTLFLNQNLREILNVINYKKQFNYEIKNNSDVIIY